MKQLLLILLTVTFAMHASYSQDRITGKNFATRSEVIAQHGMACTSQPLASQVAIDILKKGGNAIDAAIAANATLGLMEPTGNGIGGDIFAIVWDAETQQLYGLNGSGRSPKSLTLEYFKENGYESIPATGPLPVSVPGTVDGWFELHDRFGSMDMKKVLHPAIEYAREGFPVSELIAYYWQGNARYLQDFPGFKEIFMPGGEAPQKGEIFKNPYLANTLEKIAEGGRDVFYEGEIARKIDEYMREHAHKYMKGDKEEGGFLRYEDLASHESEWVEPLSTPYRGYRVWELPPNGQGTAALQILNILEGYDIASMGFGSKEHIHTFVEAKKLAFEDRAKFYADPDFADIPIDKLISKEYA
ncbi:MAG: gamma-glutamyltransferase, partial [Bacteroidales bacterium]|nr:gamma-glutamyltransferase [Bacteroidales bacterium]